MKSAAFCTLGCKVNQYETDAIQERFAMAGYEIRSFAEAADVYIINTCTVTNIADRKSRQMLHRARRRNPQALVVAVGCYVETSHGTLTEDGTADIMIGNADKDRIVAIVESRLGARPDNSLAEGSCRGRSEEDMSMITASGTGERCRAYIKIQDGCNQFCSYCIIPYARGRVKSRSPEDIADEVRMIAAAGYREIVVTGIHVSSYGIDFDAAHSVPGQGAEEDYGCFAGDALIRLIERLALTDGIERIRLGSLEPRIITEAFLKRLSRIPQICPQFHLSLQSGCDETLKRMNRHYDAAEYLASCGLIRKYFDRPAITTDVIVGFPGETEAEFEETVQFVQKVHFARMHIFRYSRRSGTRAAVMPDQVGPQLQAERSDRLLQIADRMHREYIEQCRDQLMDVLIEESSEIDGRKVMTGYSRNYIRCAFEDTDLLPGTLVKGTFNGKFTDGTLFCKEYH